MRLSLTRRAGGMLAALAPWLVGLGGFLLVAGTRIVRPANIAWLANDDPATQYLGWAFFRQDAWHIPPGVNARYGLELSSSVLYSDSIPALAIAFKPFSSVLPEPFQYFGIWILLCFLLQAYFGWKLAGLAAPGASLRVPIAGLFVFAPPMLYRLGGHWSLVGHWMLLAALYLAFTPASRHRSAWWVALAGGSALVHTYLMAMVVLLWLASLGARAWAGHVTRRGAAGEAVLVPGVALLSLWAAGFFLVASAERNVLGVYRMNALSLVNASGWSFLLPDLGGSPGEYEGFNYLGLGWLLGLVVAIPATIRLWARRPVTIRREWLPLGATIAALTAFALSNHVAIGRWTFSYPLPDALSHVASMARASGRMFWPVFYVIVLGIVTALVRGYRTRVAFPLLCAMLVVQVVDSSAGWMPYRRQLQVCESAWFTPLKSPFWDTAARLYPKLRLIPSQNKPEHWRTFADYARAHRLATDTVYLARVDRDRFEALARHAEELLYDGHFDRDTLYILQGGTARVVPCLIDPAADLLTNLDGFWVLAPGWNDRGVAGYSSSPLLLCSVLSPDQPLHFGQGGNGFNCLRSGWFRPPEAWGVRSATAFSVLDLHVEAGVSTLQLDVRSLLRGRPLDVSVLVDGRASASWHPEETAGWRALALPGGAATRRRRVRIAFSYSEVDAAAGGQWSGDTRAPAMGLLEIRAVR